MVVWGACKCKWDVAISMWGTESGLHTTYKSGKFACKRLCCRKRSTSRLWCRFQWHVSKQQSATRKQSKGLRGTGYLPDLVICQTERMLTHIKAACTDHAKSRDARSCTSKWHARSRKITWHTLVHIKAACTDHAKSREARSCTSKWHARSREITWHTLVHIKATCLFWMEAGTICKLLCLL
jgi:hypothetical protein